MTNDVVEIDLRSYVDALSALAEVFECSLKIAERPVETAQRLEALLFDLDLGPASRTLGRVVFVDPSQSLLEFIGTFRTGDLDFMRKNVNGHLTTPVAGWGTETVAQAGDTVKAVSSADRRAR